MDSIGAVPSASASVDQILSIDHVAIAVPDLETAIAWYTRALGFRVLERRVTTGAKTAMLSAVLVAGPAVVVLTQGCSADSQVSRFVEVHGPGIAHVAFEVRDIDAALRRLAVLGQRPDTPMITDTGIRQVFLKRDPASAVRVELIERRGGTFTDASVERLFRSFEERDLY